VTTAIGSPWPLGKVTPRHRDRLAVVYVRQSTPQQVIDHGESTRLQYGLTARAVELGWAPTRVLVIDEDLGHSASGLDARPGFARLVSEVGLDHVGLVLGVEMSRLARCGREWHQLLELCALSSTLLAAGLTALRLTHLDLVTVLVLVGVEVRRPAATRTLLGATSAYIIAFRDGVRDPPGPQRPPVRFRPVRLVRQQMIQPFTRPADATRPGNGDVVQQRHQLLGVGGLPGCEPFDQAAAASFGQQMQFGGQSSPRATHPLGCPRFGPAQPPLRAPAACWWARTMVESAWARQSRSPAASASVCNCCSIRAHVPSCSHRANRS
jgi:hypothetical protein